MNSIIRNSSRLAVFALCGTAMVACDSVKDVRSSPTYTVPAEKVSLSGTITGVGVGTNRPVGLTIVVKNDSLYGRPTEVGANTTLTTDPATGKQVRTTVYSLRGVRALNFGSIDVGANYTISVTTQPFGRTCVVAKSGSGTVTAEVTDIEIRCDRDSTPLYRVTANIAPALAAAPPTGFKLTLTTEEGTQDISPAANQTSVTFDNLPIFYPAANPPPFAYAVTATYPGANGTVNKCSVTNGSGELGTGGANVTNVTVNSCAFTVSAVATYSTPAGGTAQTMPTNGLKLGLKSTDGAIVLETPVITAYSTTPVVFPGTQVSTATALYQVKVTQQPTGHFCIVDNGGLASLVNPANVTAQVRCRAIPAGANQLTGTYQTVLAAEPTSRTIAAGGVNYVVSIPRPLAAPTGRHFMTFFDNGTFLYGIHHARVVVGSNQVDQSGVEHGFYVYDPTAATLTFNVFTDSNGTNNAAGLALGFGGGALPTGATFSSNFLTVFPAASTVAGLSGAPGYALPFAGGNYGPPGNVTATAVTKTAAIPSAPAPSGNAVDPILAAVGPRLSLTFGTGTAARTWTLVQPISPTWTTGPFWASNSMEGAWATADSEQVWVYDNGTSYGWHAGVNGAPNLQDACYVIERRNASFGGYTQYYSRRTTNSGDAFGGTVSCSPGALVFPGLQATPQYTAGTLTVAGVGGVDVPNTATSVPPIVPGFNGRMPGSSLSTLLSPSPSYFKVTAGAGGAADTLTVQPTLNDAAVGTPLIFTRQAAN